MALGSAWFAVKNRGFATGIVSGGIGLGTFLSGIIVPAILASYGTDGWRYSWYFLGACVIGVAGIMWLFLRNQPQDKGLFPVGQDEKEAILNPVSNDKISALDWKKVYRMKAIWYLGIVYFFYGLSYIIYMVFFAAYLVKEMGYTQAWAGGLWATVGALSIFCGVIWGSVSDRIGRGKGAAMAYLVLGLSYIIYAVVQNEFGFYLSAILFGLTAWSIPTIMAAAAGDLVGPRLAPAGLGFATLFFGIGQSIGPALGGYLADLTHSFMLPFLMAGAISLVGMIFSFRMDSITGEFNRR
jgi:MFS family permease